MRLRFAALAIPAAVLALGTGCFEGFERLDTRVVYDPTDHGYQVEQTLSNVSRTFFACTDVASCELAIWRSLAGEPPGGFDSAIADRLAQRLAETGAEDVRLTLSRRGDALDVRATYRTVAGSRAADDTAIRAEYGGGGKGKYYLAIDAQPGMVLDGHRYEVRRMAGGAGWTEAWLLKPGDFDVTVTRPIEAPTPIFADIPGLAERVAGWLDQEWTLGQPPPRPDAAPAPVPVPEPVAAAPAPPPPPAPVGGWPRPDPASPAKVYTFDPRIGGGYPPALAVEAFAPIRPRVEVCWQRSAAANPSLQGYVFLDVLLRADGSIISTSVHGDVPDPALLDCLNLAIEDWTFPPSAAPQADISFPLAVRVEAPPAPPGNRKR